MNDEHDLTRRTTLYGIASTGFLPLAGLQGGTLESQQDETGTDNSGSSLPPLAWEWTDDTSDGDQVVQDLVETQDGAIVCAGIEGDESGVQNVLLRKIDNTGEAIWSRTLGGDRNDAALGVQEAADGTLVLCGGSMSESSNLMDTTVWLTDADGTLERSISFGRPGTNDAAHAITSGSNGYVLGGGTHYLGGAFGDGVGRFVKIDDDGAEEWSTTVGGGHAGEIYDVTTTSGGQYAFVGTRAGDDGEGRAWLGVVDRTGDLEWSRTYGASGSRIGYSLVETDDGGFAFAGTTQPPGQDEPRAWVVKVDLRGDVEWERTYGGTGHDALVSILETSQLDHQYSAVGWTKSDSDTDLAWMMTLEEDGTLQTTGAFDGAGSGRFHAHARAANRYVAGGYTSAPRGDAAAWAAGVGHIHVDLNAYAVENGGDHPTITVGIANASSVDLVASFGGTTRRISFEPVDENRWETSIQIDRSLDPGTWVDLEIQVTTDDGGYSLDKFQNDYILERPTLGYHVVEEIRDVAVLLGEFRGRDPERTRHQIRTWKTARDRDTNYYFASRRGTMGTIGFDFDVYPNDNSEEDFFSVQGRSNYTDQDTGDALDEFLEDIRTEAEDDVTVDDYDVWIGTHVGDTIGHGPGRPVYGRYDSDGLLPDVGRVYTPEAVSNERGGGGYDTWLHEIGHAIGLHHLYEHGMEENTCVMGRGWRNEIDHGTSLNPTPPLSSGLRIAETLGLDLPAAYGIVGPESADDWLDADESRLDDIEGTTTEPVVALKFYNPTHDDTVYREVSIFSADGWVPFRQLEDEDQDNDDEIGDGDLEVETRPPREVGLSSADLQGRVRDTGDDFEGYFEWREGLFDGDWNTTPSEPVEQFGRISHLLSDLEEDTEYEYRAVVEGDDIMGRGGVQTFRTDERADVEITYIPEYRRGLEGWEPSPRWESSVETLGSMVVYKHARKRRFGRSDLHSYTHIEHRTEDTGLTGSLSSTGEELRDFLTPDQEYEVIFRHVGASDERCDIEIDKTVPEGQRVATNSFLSLPDDVEIPVFEGPLETPSLELFAIDAEGRRVGRDENGEYVVEIPGARASGPRPGVEWIVIPKDADVDFRVSSSGVEEYIEVLDEQGTLEDEATSRLREETSIEAHVTRTEYDQSAQLMETDEGTWVEGASTRQLVEELDTDGDWSVQTSGRRLELVELDNERSDFWDPEYIAGGGAVTAGLFYLAYRMLSSDQENDE